MKQIPSLPFIITVAAGLLAGGCTVRTLEFSGARYSSKRFGVQEKFGAVEIHSGTNHLVIGGIESDLVTGMKVGAETALKAAATLAK